MKKKIVQLCSFALLYKSQFSVPSKVVRKATGAFGSVWKLSEHLHLCSENIGNLWKLPERFWELKKSGQKSHAFDSVNICRHSS